MVITVKNALIFSFVLVCSGVLVSEWNTQPSEDLSPQVDKYLQPYVESADFYGSIVIAQGDDILHEKAYGYANLEWQVPHTLHSLFQVGSISKSFTSGAIGLLHKHGYLNYEDPVSKYILDYPRGDEITITHLLTHRSGIPTYVNFEDYREKSRMSSWTPKEVVAYFKDRPLRSKPGTAYHYSVSNFALLARIIEIISGKGYMDFMEEELFRLLSLDRTGYADPGRLVKQRVEGYEPVHHAKLGHATWYDLRLYMEAGHFHPPPATCSNGSGQLNSNGCSQPMSGFTTGEGRKVLAVLWNGRQGWFRVLFLVTTGSGKKI